MKKYIAVLEIEDDEEIVDAKISYIYSNNGMNYKATERMELKEENKDARNKTYEDGLNDAWELVRKLIYGESEYERAYSIKEINAIFGRCGYLKILKDYTASEAIKQIKEYEEKKKEIKEGDEVVDKYGWGIKGVITKISEWSISIVENDGSINRLKKEEFNKTGRHFPQIEEMLKQMQEDENEDI